MRKLFLHIGCGKTGSSALQLWLNHNAEALARLGVTYPLFGAERLDDYAITSGNGIHLRSAFLNGRLTEVLTRLARETDKHLLFSSESFQSLKPDDLAKVREIIESLGFEPVILAYVRDVYDMLHSSYQQLVKRHLYTESFREYALGQRDMQQFRVLRAWGKAFEKLKVMHYDTEKDALDASFGAALGLRRGTLPAMARRKINRSLTAEETELLRLINHFYTNRFEKPDATLGKLISDAMIAADPEARTPILFDAEAHDHIAATFAAEVDWVNRRYFRGKPVLAIHDPRGKETISETPSLNHALVVVLDVLFGTLDGFVFDGRDSRRHRHEPGARLDAADPRIVDALRDEALVRERSSIENALALMDAARVLRPSGPLLIKKTAEYRARLGLPAVHHDEG
jgi:hypothetical protein